MPLSILHSVRGKFPETAEFKYRSVECLGSSTQLASRLQKSAAVSSPAPRRSNGVVWRDVVRGGKLVVIKVYG